MTIFLNKVDSRPGARNGSRTDCRKRADQVGETSFERSIVWSFLRFKFWASEESEKAERHGGIFPVAASRRRRRQEPVSEYQSQITMRPPGLSTGIVCFRNFSNEPKCERLSMAMIPSSDSGLSFCSSQSPSRIFISDRGEIRAACFVEFVFARTLQRNLSTSRFARVPYPHPTSAIVPFGSS